MSAQNKKNNRRKALAVGLAVLGVAGLSLASAAQLNFTGPSSVQAGVATVTADCQTAAIPVAFSEPTLSGETYASSSVTLSNIADECDGKNFKIRFLGDADAPIGSEVTDIVSGATITASFSGSQHAVKKIAVVIY